MTCVIHEIEQAFLGTLIASEHAYDEHAPRIRQEYFNNPAHARIFEAIKRSRENGKSADAAMIAPLFKDDPDLVDVGGSKYIYDLAQNFISVINVNAYAEKILSEHCRRAITHLAQYIIERAKNPEFEAKTDLPTIENMVSTFAAELAEEGGNINAKPDLSGSVEKALADIHAAQAGEFGIRTGINPLDVHLRGLKPGRLYVPAGRPGMGKTTFGITIALNAARTGKKVLFFSIEMSESDLSQRILARVSGISIDKMNTPHYLTEEQNTRLRAAAEEVESLPLKIEHRQVLTAATIMSMARRFKRKYGLDLVVVDYLGLVQSDDKKSLKVHQIEEITTGLKRTANTLEIPIVLLAQLNRGVEQREDKRPQLSDLRDSGSIEQDADVVLFLYREEVYLRPEAKPVSKGFSPDFRKKKEGERVADLDAVKGKAEIIVAKNRQGRTGIIPVKFNGERQVFHE